MKEIINVKAVCGFDTSAGSNGFQSVKTKCLEWLQNTLRPRQRVELFKELSTNVMSQLFGSHNFFVMQVAVDAYIALKKWRSFNLCLLRTDP